MTSPTDTRVAIASGRGHLPLWLPVQGRITTIRKRALPNLADPAGAIRQAFETAPFGSQP